MNLFADFQFAEPQWVHALWVPLLLVVFLTVRDRSGGGILHSLIGPRLFTRLVVRAGPGRRAGQIASLGLACAAIVLALMRPQWGAREVATERSGAELMIALDVSRSMLAADVSPNRLERAKAEIIDLLSYLEGDQVGLIVFAGRASVLSPLTPDFGFLRLALENAGPHSVLRGGTRLEEPIRRAVAGFGPVGAAQRALLLITDGEDHDSFALDAAREAAEHGVTIIAIGFGSETGSQIFSIDPASGARRLLRNSDGEAVVSRLDGDLLREIALATGGAYVPAGTGVLDLESIYQKHIARLTRGRSDGRARIVREEGYPWCLLGALLALFAHAVLASSVTSGSAPGRLKRSTSSAASTALIVAVLLGAVSGPARLASAQALPSPAAAEPAGQEEPEELDPRSHYNRATQALAEGDAARAARELEEARRRAGSDAELRYRSSYNLGVALVAAAEASEASDASAALRQLREAAQWFREAVALRPEEDAARRNLEVALRRALVLEDAIAKQDPRTIGRELDALTKAQRELAGSLASLVQALADEASLDAALNAPERTREAFRFRATMQRELLSDADHLGGRADAEHSAINETPEDERSPQDQMRAAQLQGVMHYLHRARERMGQTRRGLRRRNAERAYRRGAAALAMLEQARDQLREPREVLDALLRELGSLAEQTRVMAASETALASDPQASPPPVWLSRNTLAETQSTLATRTGELDLRLRAGIEGADAGAISEEQARAIDALRRAEPLIASAQVAQNEAARGLEEEGANSAKTPQRAALEALAEAREHFLDLRGLLELAYQRQRWIQAVLAGDEARRSEALEALRSEQHRNRERARRAETDIASKLAQLESQVSAAPESDASSPGQPDEAGSGGEAADEQRHRYQAATQLMTQVLAGMDEATRALGAEGSAEAAAHFGGADRGARRAARGLAALRRLFFTIAEQVREVAEEQSGLSDDTRNALVADADSQQTALAPVLARQEQLTRRSESIADELLEQSQQAVSDPDTSDGSDASSDASNEQGDAERLRLAAEYVLGASSAMAGAGAGLSAEPLDGDKAVAEQAEALEELAKALALLEPPQEPKDGDQSQQDAKDDRGDQGDQDEGGNSPQQGESGEDSRGEMRRADAARLLQGVRDREAERQRTRTQRSTGGSEAVERDW